MLANFDSSLALVCAQVAVYRQQVEQIHGLGAPAGAANDAYRGVDTLLQRIAASGLSCTDFQSKKQAACIKTRGEVAETRSDILTCGSACWPGLRWEDEAAGRMWSGRQLYGGAGGALGSGVIRWVLGGVW